MEYARHFTFFCTVLVLCANSPLNGQWKHINGTGILNITGYSSIGSTWNALNGGLTHFGVRALALFGNCLFMGGDITGVRRCPLSALIANIWRYVPASANDGIRVRTDCLLTRRIHSLGSLNSIASVVQR